MADSLNGLDTEPSRSAAISANNMVRSSVVVKDLSLKNEDKDKESSYKDKDLSLKDEDKDKESSYKDKDLMSKDEDL